MLTFIFRSPAQAGSGQQAENLWHQTRFLYRKLETQSASICRYILFHKARADSGPQWLRYCTLTCVLCAPRMSPLIITQLSNSVGRSLLSSCLAFVYYSKPSNGAQGLNNKPKEAQTAGGLPSKRPLENLL